MASIRVKEPVPEEADVNQGQAAPEEPISEAPVATEPETAKLSHKLGMIRSLTPRKLIGIALLLVIVVLFISSIKEKSELKDQINELSQAQNQPKEAQDAAEAENLKQEVGAFLELPADELPTVATVVDASKVKNQSFFANSQNGDKVLLFPKAGKAVLYRQSTKKIIEVAPINLGDGQASTSPAPAASKPAYR